MRKFALALAILLVAVIAGTVHVQTQDEDERGYVESLVQRLLSAEGRPVTVEGISIGFTGNVTAERVAVRDEAGEWLVIEDFGLDWRPLSLFTDTLVINTLSAERMTMLRQPEAAPPAEAPEEAANLIAAEIGALSIEELEIAAPVAGTAARFTVSGSGSLSAAPAEIRLALNAERIDEVEGSLVADVLFEQATRNLDLELVLVEGRGGFVQQLLSLENQPTVDLRVSGQGPVSDWSGDLQLALDEEQLVAGTVRLTGTDTGTMIETQIDGQLTRLVPSEFDELVQGRSELAAAIMLEDAGVRIDSAILRSEVAEITADGMLDFETDEVLFSLTGQLGYAGPVEIAQAEILRLAFEARVEGTLDAPEWAMNASAESLNAAGIAGRNLTLEIAGAGLPGSDRAAEARIIASGDLEPGDSELPPVLAGPFLADLSFDMPGEGRVVLENGYVETESGAVSATGHFTTETGSYELALDAQLSSPETGNAALDSLLQGHTRLVGSTTGIFPDVVRLHDVALTSDVLTARLSGELLPENMEFSASAVISELSRLDDRAAGAIELEATLTGPLGAPEAVIEGRGNRVTLMGKPFQDVAFEAAGHLDPDEPTGALRLTGNLDAQPVDISATLVHADGDGPNVELSASVGSARINGALAIPPVGEPSGRLVVSAPDLSHLGPLLLAEVGGALEADIEIVEEGEQSTALISAEGRDMTFGALAAATIDADLRVEDLFGTPRPRGDARLTGVRAGGVELAAVELETEAVGAGRFAIALEASGPRMNFTARAMTEAADGMFLVTLEQLSGRLDGNDLSLVAPASIRFADESIRIERAEIAAGGGRVIVAGTLTPRLEATIEVSDLQLAMASDLAPEVAPTGVVSGTLALSGTLEAPQARFALTGSNVSVAALRDYGLPPLALQVQGDFAEQHLTFISTARGPEPTELEIGGTVSLSEPNRVDVTVRGRVPSRLVADELAEAGLRLDAMLDVDLSVAGPLDAIAVTGAVTTAGATFGDVDGRFIVRDANARIVLADGVARIEQLQGATGRDGTASITGTIATAAPHEANLAIELERGTYSDGTLLVTTFDASLTLTGPLTGTPLVAGRVDLIGPKLTLNEPLPVAMAALDIDHINAPMGVQRQAATLAARRSGGGGNLALDVEIVVRDQFSVRGRGLDVDLGGRLRLTGTTGNLRATGGFLARDGRLDLLGQRVVIERGQLDFVGDLDPRIMFAAVARRDGFQIELVVSGRATSPEITVTSSPMLPQEEALSRLIFGSSLAELSPFQIAQLAAAVATLSGGGDGGGIMANLGDAIGLDRFEVIQTESGETRVSAGRQITENISLGIEQGREPGSTRVNIDLDVTENVRLRGSMGSDGTSKAGVFFQKDY